MTIVLNIDRTKQVHVDQGEYIPSVFAGDLNIFMRCRGGGCGACKTQVVEGLDELAAPTRNEEYYRENRGLEPDQRLLCQVRCRGGEGTVVIAPVKREYDALGRKIG